MSPRRTTWRARARCGGCVRRRRPPGAAGRPGCCRWRPACSTTADRAGSRRIRPRSRRASRPGGPGDSPSVLVPAAGFGGPTCCRAIELEIAPPVGTTSRWPTRSRLRLHPRVRVLEQPAAHPVPPGDAAHGLAPGHEVLDEGHPLLAAAARRTRRPSSAPRPAGSRTTDAVARRRRQTEVLRIQLADRRDGRVGQAGDDVEAGHRRAPRWSRRPPARRGVSVKP